MRLDKYLKVSRLIKRRTLACEACENGKVKVNDFLRVRSGPGTSYAIAGYLSNNTAVEILEQKTVGSTRWGRIDKG